MATAEASLTGLPQADASQDLARSWRRLTRAATAVAVATSPAVYIWFTQRNDWVWWKALLATVAIIVVFRGFSELLFRRLIPTPSLFGIESRELREEDVVGRRRAWFWKFWFKVFVWFFVIITIVWLFRGGTWWGTIGFILDGMRVPPKTAGSAVSRCWSMVLSGATMFLAFGSPEASVPGIDTKRLPHIMVMRPAAC